HDDAQALLAERGDGVARRWTHGIGDREQPRECPVDRYQDDARAFATMTIGRGIERLGISADPTDLRRVADHDRTAVHRGADPQAGL
nr:hypothetical protein [Tanacetum cinerariifolium]